MEEAPLVRVKWSNVNSDSLPRVRTRCLICQEHQYGPIDTWYDCSQCLGDQQGDGSRESDWVRNHSRRWVIGIHTLKLVKHVDYSNFPVPQHMYKLEESALVKAPPTLEQAGDIVLEYGRKYKGTRLRDIVDQKGGMAYLRSICRRSGNLDDTTRQAFLLIEQDVYKKKLV